METTIDFEFDCPFTVAEDGTATRAENVYFDGTVTDSNTHGIEIDGVAVDGTEWEPVTGYSAQYSYSGPVMHSSELMGCFHRHFANYPGTYVAAAVYDGDLVAGDEVDGSTPIGWILLARKV